MDISDEQLIPIQEVPRHLPTKSTGRRVHISAVYRWIKHGVAGGIRLKTVKMGGSTYTSKEALQRFADRLSAARDTLSKAASVTAARQKQIDDASREVESILKSKVPRRSSG